ncbi:MULTISPECIES: class I SAM-dependent methyltransferase [Thalassospira]|uniref:SAM-dependent methyltransferase n=1 Tax=Thalassospira tepidiphila TaxID=393657 RepID=A0ABX0WYB1_9PROT|nr:MULTISPECIES: class I SAM-dependent methyltransferase [Thalassospira]MBO6578852.1 class I SAM-dependent methyltransferase [Thalassospira sp.]MBO6816841.1 class I SAM-dependent methyltransferase [Thalassospira sp.]MBO6889041.1 class I SAM-dependent methyltransferase [Thalassospira sp.]NJB74296.1 SAM-dependent methyltransferase [Thalassospira tepidiphila]
MSSQLPSSWVTQHCPTPHPARNRALDLACGKGRHSFWLADQGWQVTAIDRDLSQTDTDTNPAINWIEADLETGSWPLGDKQFDLIVVTNYLHRPLFEYLRDAVRPGGTLIYETFMVGNEAYGRPRSPDFLLRADELADTFSDWTITAHQQGPVRAISDNEITAIKQSIVAQKPG